MRDFERPFVNLCFALATGVGKTRLMGAFISYLYLEHGVRHFLVLAPNLTIYRKLIADFTPGHPKYVLQGVAELAVQPPVVVTGDNWESGIGVRAEAGRAPGGLFDAPVHINIFNSAKLVARGSAKEMRRLRSVQETIGESYFDYLAGLDDLVILMDEAHRYRAEGAMEAIVELKPILGIELTATPQIEQGGRKATKGFDNVVYRYQLAAAMRDGYVKQPAVATKEGMQAADAKKIDETTLDRIKLEDGVRVHEATKVELDTYARNSGRPRVKPFVLVIARDTKHSAELLAHMRSEAFFGGAYADKVIEVNSGQSGTEKDDNIELLLGVERADNPVEIVVHVNMLKEGWDVTNLYTIVPLRTADSKTLVEQSIGRGLRLPYGKPTRDAAVDRLTIIAHDHFEAIVAAAKQGGYSFSEVVLPVSGEPKKKTVSSTSTVGAAIAASEYGTGAARELAEATVTVIGERGHSICTGLGLPTTQASLSHPEVQEAICRAAVVEAERMREVARTQGGPDYAEAVPRGAVAHAISEAATAIYVKWTVQVPRITLLPREGAKARFTPFEVELGSMSYAAVSDRIVIQNLTRERGEQWEDGRVSFGGGLDAGEAVRLSDYLVRGLRELPEVSYDHHADFLYGLAEQVVEHLRGYLPDDEAVERVLRVYQKQIVANLHAQIEGHRWEEDTEYAAEVTQAFLSAQPQSYTVPEGAEAVDFRDPVPHKREIRSMIFKGFRRGYFDLAKFDSDSERSLAVIVDREAGVQAWLKPARGTFEIFYVKNARYEPDFVVQTEHEMWILEPKARDEMNDPIVEKKAQAAVEWCKHATKFGAQSGDGRPWRYALIPHDVITESMSLQSLLDTHGKRAS